jgi:hypothetical protein
MSTDAPTNADPNGAKPEPPKGLLDKLGAALPIGLTALATVFAGMSTGALQQAMYWKGQAGQDQSKATSQWTFAGFKVDRGLTMQTAAAQLAVAGAGHKPEFVPNPDKKNDEKHVKAEKTAIEWLGGKGPPGVYRRGADSKAREGRVGLPDLTVKELPELLDMIRERQKEDEILQKARHVSKTELNDAIDAAEKANVEITDKEWGPVIDAARALVRDAIKKAVGDSAKIAAAQAALFELESRRYRSEATLNQEIASLYEARVQTSTAESDKHRQKSQTLFLAMLVAQIGGVVSSLALARQRKSALWAFAATVGLVAVGVGGYALLTSM